MKVTALLILSLVATPPALAQHTFHGNARRTGAYDGAGPARLGVEKWVFRTGGAIVASPAIAGGVVYIGSLDGHLHAIDQESGAEKWKFKSRMPIASTPAVDGSMLYFTSSVGSLAALDVVSGTPQWVFVADHDKKFEAKNLHGYAPTTQTIPDAWDVFTSSPVVDAGRVFFGTGDGGVYAVDATTGILQWKFQTQDVVHASPTVADGTVFIGSWDSRFYALEAATGRERWRFQAGEDEAIHNQVGFQSSAAVDGDTVYVGCRDAHVYALDAATGRKKWDYPTSKSWVIGTPAVRDGTVYFGTSDSARFLALDAENGRLRFNFDVKAYVFSSAAIAGNRVYFGSHNGRLYAIDAQTGVLAWDFRTEASKADPLGVLNPDGSFNETLYAPVFGDFQDMYVSYLRLVSVGAIFSSPVVDRGVVYFGSTDGNLYALR